MQKRILITIVGQGSVVHIIRTGILKNMQQFCTPVVGILWDEQLLKEELNKSGIESHVLPDYQVSYEYQHLRTKINSWYTSKVLKSPSAKIQSRYLAQYYSTKKRIKTNIKNLIAAFQQSFPAYTLNLKASEKEQIKKEVVFYTYEKWLENLHIEGLYTVTPFLQEVELLTIICKEKGLPVISAIHSFDNITKRGWSSVFFDHYLVWNKYNKAELERINPALKEKITITGAPQFDFHFNTQNIEGKESWLFKMKMPTDKKIILYSGGPASLFPNEPQYLKYLHNALANGLISNAVILFRSHPLDKIERWKKFVGESSFIIYDKAPNGTIKLDYTNVTDKDVWQLIATLMYTDVHINVCSTMAIDGSVFKKPQIAPAYDEAIGAKQHLLKKMYSQEHYIPVIKSGNIHLASSGKHLVSLVNEALTHPEAMTLNAEKCVREIITYTDGRSTERIISVLQKLFSYEHTACLQ